MMSWAVRSAVAATAVVMLGTAGWETWAAHDAHGAPPPAAGQRPCADPWSKPEYIVHVARDVVVATVSGVTPFSDGELLSLHVEKTLKGAVPAEVVVGQPDGMSPQAEPLIQTLEPGRRYVVSLIPAESYGDGLVWGAVRTDDDAEPDGDAGGATGTEEIWREAVGRSEEPPHCEGEPFIR
ncbi:hypothetical protein [Streptomyces sp. NBC_00454]|uniref:hypothetical protein n=1 Tax=Streptomyces sp. NBC_00454 TaxID=2975747 RepID=UPI0030E48530